MAAMACSQLGKFDEAMAAVERALQMDTSQPIYYLTRGHIQQGLGRNMDAAESFREALRRKPELAEAQHSLGIALQDMGHSQEAAASFRAALAINPRHARACFNLAVLNHRQGRYDEAIAGYRQAVALRPEYAEASFRLGILLSECGRFADAAECLRQALAHRPDHFESHFNLGICLERLCQLPAAISAYQAAIKLRPDAANVFNCLGNALVNFCHLDEALEALRNAVRLRPDDAQIHSNLLVCLNYHPACSNAEIFLEHLEWARRHASHPVAESRHHDNFSDPGRRLRVAYVSPSFGRGAVQYFLGPLLKQHCQTELEVFAYSTSSLPLDAYRGRDVSSVHWREVEGLDAAALGQQIRADAIDILVDLSGHTPGHRLLTFARRPAPVQISWLDYFNTTGLGEMDYLISDLVHTPPDGSQQFSEQLAFMPDCRLCYEPPIYAPEVAIAPISKNGYITFGCFNRLSKLTSQCIELWCQLLHAIPDAKLVLKSHSLNDPTSWGEYHGRFARHGIDPQRIELRAASNHQQMLGEYGDIDIALDPFPYNGGLTTCEALWMGVPVIALIGDRMIARQSAALLSAAGLKQFIANSPEEYIGIAKGWATDPDRLVQLRQTLRRQVADSPLCDGQKFARNMERLYREMWRRWCAGVPISNLQ